MRGRHRSRSRRVGVDLQARQMESHLALYAFRAWGPGSGRGPGVADLAADSVNRRPVALYLDSHMAVRVAMVSDAASLRVSGSLPAPGSTGAATANPWRRAAIAVLAPEMLIRIRTTELEYLSVTKQSVQHKFINCS